MRLTNKFKETYKILIIFTIIILTFSSCSDTLEEPVVDQDVETSENVISTVKVFVDNPTAGKAANEIEEMLTNLEFSEGDRIFISQRGTTTLPNFPAGTVPPVSNNFYVYKYKPNTGATWEEGYNFENETGYSPLKWSSVKQTGSVGNSFQLFALYCPANYIEYGVDNGNLKAFGSSEWQNNYDAQGLKNLDILGAYHSFSSLWTRLRFKFYHLTTCIHVTLLVPEVKVSGNKISGFDETAFMYSKHMTIYNVRSRLPGVFLGLSSEHAGSYKSEYRNISRRWTIDWSASRTSDLEGPYAAAVPLATSTGPYGDTRSNICLYPVGPDYNEDGTVAHHASFEEITIIPKDYYPNGSSEPETVRRYDFYAIIGAQNIKDELLYIRIRKPGTAIDDSAVNPDLNIPQPSGVQSYYMSVNQLVEGKEDISFTQGTFNHITLYIPRVDQTPVLVSAEVKPWTTADTEMTVTEVEDEDAPNADDR